MMTCAQNIGCHSCHGNGNLAYKILTIHIFPLLVCWEVICTFWAFIDTFSWNKSFSWAFWHQNHKNRPMFDKMRTERWNYATKTKWPPIESQIFNIVRFQQNMTQIVPFIIPIKKANRHKFLKYSILELYHQNVWKTQIFLIGGGIFK